MITTSNSDNHAGWNVEELRGKEGWVAYAGPFPSKEFTTGYCEWLKESLPRQEFRVYEALTRKVKEKK